MKIDNTLQCGGDNVRIKIMDQNGMECLTERKHDFSKGTKLSWSKGKGLGEKCSKMVVSNNSFVFLETTSGDDYCPERVSVTSVRNHIYELTLHEWYDDKHNGKPHALSLKEKPSGKITRLDKLPIDLWQSFGYIV